MANRDCRQPMGTLLPGKDGNRRRIARDNRPFMENVWHRVFEELCKDDDFKEFFSSSATCKLAGEPQPTKKAAPTKD